MSAERDNTGCPSLSWIKSSYSSKGGGECVEVALTKRLVHVRDSKETDRIGLAVGGRAWTNFLELAIERDT